MLEGGSRTARFRKVSLADNVQGKLYLQSMPGRHENLVQFWSDLNSLGVNAIVCLAPLDEIREKSPMYAAAIEAGTVPCAIRRLPVCDYQAPDDDQAFRGMAVEVADRLGRGEGVLVHCGAGIGRTGMFAIGALIVLGLSTDEARRSVRAAGSEPESPAQEEALRRLATHFGRQLSQEERGKRREAP